MTKICVISDLHLEHEPEWDWPNELPYCDVLVAAGDIHSPGARAVEVLDRLGVPVIAVGGNHELYNQIAERDEPTTIRAAAESKNVHYLTGAAGGECSVVIAGVRFVGSTLWTDWRLHGDPNFSASVAWTAMRDYKKIARRTEQRKWQRLSPRDTALWHQRDTTAIQRVLEQPFNGATVVVTHHAPHPASLEPALAKDPCAAAYASDLTAFIERYRPEAWLHGHTHWRCDYDVAGCRVVNNPKGYGPHRRERIAMQWPDFSFERGVITVVKRDHDEREDEADEPKGPRI